MKENNPILFLYSKLWTYSKGNHKKIILYMLLSIIAHAVLIISPLLISQILNLIQTTGITESNIYIIFGLLLMYFVIDAVSWVFHWPSRIIERENAFFVRAQYKAFLMKSIAKLPVEWHSNNHSGDINDKIDKSSNALFLFSSNTFMIIGPILSFILSITMLLIIYPLSAIVIIPLFIIAIIISLKFDKILIKQYDYLNHSENHVAEKIIDALTNIFTVIILRIENLVNKSINQSINHPKSVYLKNIKLNETKWVILSLLGTFLVITAVSVYIWNSFFSDSRPRMYLCCCKRRGLPVFSSFTIYTGFTTVVKRGFLMKATSTDYVKEYEQLNASLAKIPVIDRCDHLRDKKEGFLAYLVFKDAFTVNLDVTVLSRAFPSTITEVGNRQKHEDLNFDNRYSVVMVPTYPENRPSNVNGLVSGTWTCRGTAGCRSTPSM